MSADNRGFTLAMAAGQFEPWQVLEKEVTCPLCLDLFKEPRKLPCDHVYCKDCLKGIALRRLDRTVSCPECRNVSDIPNNDVNDYPTAFYINRLVEAFQQAQEETNNRKDNPTQSCVHHMAQPLALYCETCKIMLCRDCIIMTKKHEHHEFGYIENVAKKYRENHEERLQTTEEFGRFLSQVEPIISEADSIIASEERVNLEEIDHAFEELHKTLEKSKQAMRKQLSRKYQSALNTALENKRQIEKIRAETAYVTALVESALEGQTEALFTQEEQIENNMKKLQKRIEQFISTTEPSLPVPEVMSCEMLQKQLDMSNFFYPPADPSKCRIVESLLKRAERGHVYTLTVNLVDSKGNKCLKGSQKIVAELRSIRDYTTTAGIIQRHSPSSVSITFMSPKRGRNSIRVTIRGSHIRDSPQTINFLKPLSRFEQPIKEIGSLERPAGLTTSGNSLLAVEYSCNRILKYNTAFEVTAEYGRDKLKGPIALTRDRQMNIYVTTVQDHKIHKFKGNGAHIMSIGTKGTLPGQFNFPMGLCINSRKQLYICDSRNDRVQVFDLQLKFKRMFGRQGSGKGQFQFPTDIAFDSSDNIYVCDSHNHQIQVFTPSGGFICFIRNKWTQFGPAEELQLPLNVCIFNDLLYVTQTKQNYIVVFKTTGELVKRFGHGVLQQSEGIEVDADGYVYVSSHHSKIFVF